MAPGLMLRDDDWLEPKPRKRGRPRRSKPVASSSSDVKATVARKNALFDRLSAPERDRTVEALLTKIANRTTDVSKSKFYGAAWQQLRPVLCDLAALGSRDGKRASETAASLSQATDAKQGADACQGKRIDIVCYGLGSIQDSVHAQLQLALLVLLIRGARLELGKDAVVRAFAFDPVLTHLDETALRRLGCGLIDINEKGKRPAACPTLFYMPHCPRKLYSNVLWANWGSALGHVAILGNNLRGYQSRLRGGGGVKPVDDAVARVLPHTDLIACQNTFAVSGVFNDLCLHTFKLPVKLWNERPAAQAVDGEVIED